MSALQFNSCRYRRGPKRGEPSLGAYCEKGIDIRRLVGGSDYGWACRTPCSPNLWKADQPAVPFCVYYDAPTEAEIAAQTEEINAWMAIVFPWVESLKAKHARGTGGTEPCPMCGKPAHFSIASLNGHIHVKCETPDCLAVME